MYNIKTVIGRRRNKEKEGRRNKKQPKKGNGKIKTHRRKNK